mmetsp:Transcript_6632/g.9896  ORF Transcript_6632/g.9896 Transcript_6632/m.9896 type:complete len:356 (+) Transcript_6632:233-1300(+)
MYTTTLLNHIHNLSRNSSSLSSTSSLLTTTSKMKFNQHLLLHVATIATCASAFSVLPSTTTSYISSSGHSSGSRTTIATRGLVTSSPYHRRPLASNTSTTTATSRLYGSNSNSNNNDKENILKKAANKIKSILPWKSKNKNNSNSKSSITAKQKAKKSVSTSIETALKDAPLGIKLMGKLIAPIVTNLVGVLAQSMEESQLQFDNVMRDVVYYLQIDPRAQLGGAVEVGSPFSQSSSTMIINGQKESRMQASFEVKGVNGGGIATVTAVNGVIQSLVLNANGRNIDIDTNAAKSANVNVNDYSNDGADYTINNSRTVVDNNDYKAKKATDGIGKNHNRNKDDIIDVEFVEKKVSK